MSELRKITCLGLSLPLMLAAACGTDSNSTPASDASAPAAEVEHRHGFVSLVDGAVGVVDLQTMSVVHRVKETAHASHMLHALPETRELVMGDWDTQEVIVVRFNEDYTSHEVVERVASPVQMHGFMTMGEGDRYILVTSRLELKAGVLFDSQQDDRSVARYDRETGAWSVLELDSPSYASVGPDGRLYVANVHHKSISIVDLGTFSLVETVRVGDEDWGVAGEAIGPKGLSFSPDGSTLVSADYEGLSLTVWDVTANGLQNKRVIPTEGAPKAAMFSPEGDELWVVIYGLTNDETRTGLRTQGGLESMGDWYHGPQPADEANNAYRTTKMVVLDARTFDEVSSIETPKAMIAPRFANDGSNLVYVTTSAGSVYSIDRTADTPKITGEALVGRVGLPVVCGNLAL